MNDGTEQHMPFSMGAEVAVLGSMLLDGTATLTASLQLKPTDFHLDSHHRIYRAMLKMLGNNLGIDTVTLTEQLRRSKELDAIGGEAYLCSLTEGIPRQLNVDSYVQTVRHKAQLRSAIQAAQALSSNAMMDEDDPEPIIQQAIATLQSIQAEHDETDMQSVGTYLDSQGDPAEMFEQMATVNGIRLGMMQFDDTTSGCQPEDLIIVAARPSMGKTAFACNVAYSCAVKDSRTVAFFTLEQKRKDMVRRMLSSATRIDYTSIRKGTLRDTDKAILLERRDMLREAPLYIDDTPGLTATRIKAKCSRLKSQHGLDLIIVDQLSHVSGIDVEQKGMQLREVVGKQTKLFKSIARELQVPVIVLNQIARPDGKSDPRPKLHNLKESGNIEEDADVVVFLHRPEYYDKDDAALQGVGEIIIAKNREGETKTCACTYNGRIMRWEDATDHQAVQDSFDDYYRP